MTSKEMEARSGMTRANIRFYESEGLLSPARSANGYREYTEEDLLVLQRIHLLRMLRLPLEDIKAMHRGERSLHDTMAQHMEWLQQEQQELSRSRTVCGEIRESHSGYRSLDAERYLEDLKRQPEQSEAAIYEDVLPPLVAPWRRYFARGFDYTLYVLFWDLFLIAVCNVRISAGTGGFFGALIPMALMLFLEPLWLRLFSTTPGKWILGLSVTADDGRRLRYAEGFSRTLSALWWGEGAGIPIFQIVRLWKSYTAHSDGETLPWEYDSTLTLRDSRRWRAWALVVGYVLVGVLLGAAMVRAELPRHRGEITAEEFAQNFNKLAAYHDYDFGAVLTGDGTWERVLTPHMMVSIADGPQDFVFAEKDGVLTAVGFSYHAVNEENWMPNFRTQMYLAALSFAGAQEDFRIMAGDQERLAETIRRHPYESFTLDLAGVRIVCDVEYEGYLDEMVYNGYLIPIEGADCAYHFAFSMEKIA
ncbi:MAG: MerR family transcriptional regulator [Ruminococcaceae bacterium]|nr:MerR family transcriptional regulator [Oscillospiraceae bacterium]